MLKKELVLEEKLNLLQKEVNLLGDDTEKVRLDLEEGVDSLRLEIEAVKMIMQDLVPDFREKYSSAKNTVMREIDPQWLGRK